MFIFDEANSTVATDNGLRYWTYTSLFYDKCASRGDYSLSCSETQQIAAGKVPMPRWPCAVPMVGRTVASHVC
jgi:hypothetical protein